MLNVLSQIQTEIIPSFMRLHPSTAFQTLLLTMKATPILLRDSFPCSRYSGSSDLNLTIPIHLSSLIPKTDVHSCYLIFDHFQFTLIQGLNISDSYAILFFIPSDCTFTIRRIHNWLSFLPWCSLFILSGAISPLFPSNILDTCDLGGLILQCHIFLPFHGVLKERILKWFDILFSSGSHFFRPCLSGTCLSVTPHSWMTYLAPWLLAAGPR